MNTTIADYKSSLSFEYITHVSIVRCYLHDVIKNIINVSQCRDSRMAKSGKTRYRDNSIKADQHTNLLQTSFSITHEKSYVGGCIQNYHPYLAFLFSLFCYPYISNAFPFACLHHQLQNCQQPSPLSGVEQWRQSQHDVESAERKFYSYYI